MKGGLRVVVATSCLIFLSVLGWRYLQPVGEKAPDQSSNSAPDSNPAGLAVKQATSVSPEALERPIVTTREVLPPVTTEVHLSAPLEPLYKAALHTKVVEERASAFRIASLCLAKEGEVPTLTKAEVVQFMGIRSQEAEKYLKLRDDANARLRAFCATGNSDNFLTELRNSPQPALGPIFRSAHIHRERDASDQQQNLQAFTQLLANPDQYPAQFDAWLDSGAFLALGQQYGLNNRQAIEVGHLLFEKFVPASDLMQIRKWRHCIDQLLCDKLEKDGEVARTAAEIENNIRTQRWNALLVKQ